MLAVLNTELGADFDLDVFEHVAAWDAEQEWIEMRLRAATAQTVHVPGIALTAEFAAGEEMRTEVSAKFRREGVTAELAAAGFTLLKWWTDQKSRFGLSLSTPGHLSSPRSVSLCLAPGPCLWPRARPGWAPRGPALPADPHKGRPGGLPGRGGSPRSGRHARTSRERSRAQSHISRLTGFPPYIAIYACNEALHA